MAYTAIDDPSAHFHTQLYTGSGSSGLSVTNGANAGDFKPDLLWIKPRSLTDNNVIFDSSRGSDRQLKPNGTDAEDTHSPARITFETDGFDVDTTDQNYNQSSATYVAWQWIANGGTTSSNSSGDITTTVQANTTAGFSIFTYTGTGTDGDTIGHGLGAVPDWIWIKARSIANDQTIYHSANTSAPETEFLIMQDTDATSDSNTRWSDTAPTSTLITLGNNAGVNGSTQTYVGYAFAEKQGYSKFGTYTGTSNADGPFIYTGFKPAWIILKRSSSTGNWLMYDNKRDTDNEALSYVLSNKNDAESTAADGIDLLSNGFKIRRTGVSWNNSGDTYIYMAFAEHPFVSSKGVPTTAR